MYPSTWRLSRELRGADRCFRNGQTMPKRHGGARPRLSTRKGQREGTYELPDPFCGAVCSNCRQYPCGSHRHCPGLSRGEEDSTLFRLRPRLRWALHLKTLLHQSAKASGRTPGRGGEKMSRSDLRVEVQDPHILVAMRGTCLRAKYRKQDAPW
jgi:hypothetical protein